MSDDTTLVALVVLTDAPGAKLAKGTVVRKVNSQPGDGHHDGAVGVVLGSMGPAPAAPDIPPGLVGEYAYFVDWEGTGVPVAVMGRKLVPHYDA